MKAGVASPNGVVIADIPQPKPKPTDVLVQVKAIALNRADLARRAATPATAPRPAPVGSEFAGEVVEVGAEAKRLQGRRPRDVPSPGSYAEYAVSDYGRTMPFPEGMSFEQAAMLPIGLQHAAQRAGHAGRLKAGESVMMQGASSGVGIIGLQIAKLKGAKLVIGTSTNDARRARLKEFGADLAVDTNDAEWPEQVLKATGGKGVNLTVDMVSGPAVNQIMQATAVLGRIVNIGRLAGRRPSSTSTCMRGSASTISASPSAPARSRRCARFSA